MYLHTKWEEIPLSPMQGRGGFCITDKNSKTGMNSSFVPVLLYLCIKRKEQTLSEQNQY